MPGLRDPIDLFGDIFDQLTVTDGSIYVSPPPADWDPVTEPGSGTLEDPYHLISTALAKAIQVKRSGSTYGYRVKSIDVLSKAALARNAEEIFAQTGAGWLVIITCDDWDGGAWRSNIVTIATPV
jgi:hypothetical protein